MTNLLDPAEVVQQLTAKERPPHRPEKTRGPERQFRTPR
jgi:hypothetical protein